MVPVSFYRSLLNKLLDRILFPLRYLSVNCTDRTKDNIQDSLSDITVKLFHVDYDLTIIAEIPDNVYGVLIINRFIND